MRTKLVTSYYPFHSGEPYWGQVNRDRWYKYSLAAISEMGEIVCYTDVEDKRYSQLIQYKEDNNLDNLTIKTYSIKDNPYQDRVYKIRTEKGSIYNNPESIGYYTRPTVIYWMKFLFLNMEYEPDTQLYWIDSGLSHSGLFPSSANSYSIEPEFKTFFNNNLVGNEYKLYHYDKAFTPEVLESINNYAEDKIVNLYRTYSDDNPSEFKIKLGFSDNFNRIYPVAGFFGGKSDLIVEYTNVCKNFIEEVLDRNEICSEQVIMGYVNATNREWFKNWKFDTFYHEDWVNLFIPGQISFSHFFLKPLL